MKDILITSSVLILALLVIRRVFRDVLSSRARYALWALVLVRLLVPVNLPAADFSVLTAARPAVQAVDQAFHAAPVYLEPMEQYPASEYPNTPDASVDSATILWDPVGNRPDGYLALDPGGETVTKYAVRTYHGDLILAALSVIWKAGMAVVGSFFLFSNLAFYVKLRKTRTEWTPTVARKVYLVPDGVLPSPCLFLGSIYLTPAALASEESIYHVLAHEETHAAHWDPLWALLRCICLTVYWFDPLVWVAAICAKTDCELACDEAVLARLDEPGRLNYGQTLLSLIPVKRGDNPLLTATTMTAGKKQLKDRLTRIAQRPRQLASAVVAVALLALVLSACTFSEARIPTVTPSPSPTPIESEPSAPAVTPSPPEETGADMSTVDRIVEEVGGAVWVLGSMEEADGSVWVWGTSAAPLQIQSDLDLIMEHSDIVHLYLRIPPEDPKRSYGTTPDDYKSGRNFLRYFTDPDTFLWSFAEAEDLSSEARTTLKVYGDDHFPILIFTEGSDIVCSIGRDESATYYRAEPAHPEDPFSQDIFSFVRAWYDEVEIACTRGEFDLIPDEGQSLQEIAEAGAEAYGQVKLHVTPGSKYACTYAKAVDVEVLPDMPESWFPEGIAQYPHFAFSFSFICLPENEVAARWFQADNATPYEGSDPDMPDGALQTRYQGAMVLIDGHWFCCKRE